MEDLILYGGPGCGKTTAGLNWLMDQVEVGADPRTAAFVSYTNAAVNEGSERISARFGIDPKEMPYSRTLHSLAKRCLGITHQDWCADNKLGEFADAYGYDLKRTRKSADEEGIEGIREAAGADAPYLKVWDFGRHRLLTQPEQAFNAFLDYEPTAQAYLRRSRYLEVIRDYEAWKMATRRHDYTDLFTGFVVEPIALPVSVAVIDEAQDLSPLMWRVVDLLFADAPRRAVLGDDDQAIYSFSGAEPRLMNSRPTRRKVKLTQSHRLPAALVENANRIIEANEEREPKHLEPVQAGGAVEWVRGMSDLPLMNGGSWFLLVRNWRLLSQLTDELLYRGIPYVVNGGRTSPWNDSGPYRAAVTLRSLGDGQPVTLRDLWDLTQHTPSGNSKKPGVWTHGSKKRLEDRVGEHPEDRAGWRDLLDLGMTQEAFLRVMQRDLGLMTGKIPAATLDAYEASIANGTWGQEPKVTLGSIHSVKGKERDHVAVLAGCTAAPYRALRQRERADEERRVAYVGATRARQTLYVLPPMPAPGVFPWEAIS